jgi:long-chain acyl-CoA synthetase
MLGDMLDRAPPPEHLATSVAAGSKNLVDLFLRRAAATPSKAAWRVKRGGIWRTSTFDDFYRSAAAVATYLMDCGIGLGDKIGIAGGTRPEWCIADFGSLLAGGVSVGAYTTLTAEQLAYIFDHADARIAIVEGKAEIDKLLAMKSSLPKLERVIVWDTKGCEDVVGTNDWFVPLDKVLQTPMDRARIDERAGAIKSDDVAILIYTSGTTGPPKGAMISHGNLVTFLKSAAETRPVAEDEENLSFLPMAHAAERVAGFYGRVNFGTCASFASSVPAVLEELKEVRPTVFGSVPRIFEKAYSRMMAEVQKASPGKQKAFRWAEGVARTVVADWQAGRESSLLIRAQYRLADRIVFKKIRSAFGGRVRYFVTGAAPIPRHIIEFFWGAGIPIYEVYGMTEATVMTHGNRPGIVRLGSVGKTISCIEDRIADDGEILVRGKTVFLGYYKDPAATADAIDADGWLHTGDVGRKDADGFVFITDRKKHIIITSGGKNITPANIEQEIKACDALISQVHAHGDKRAYCTAIVTIHPLEAIEWAKERGMLSDPVGAEAMRMALLQNPLVRPAGLEDVMTRVTSHPDLQKRVVEAVRKANRQLSRVETIKRVHLLNRDFSLEDDEITPTLKVKRKNIEKKFAATFDRLYEEEGFGLVVIDK